MASDTAAPYGEYIANNGLWLTAGEVIEHLSKFPADFPVTALTPDGGGWYNLPGINDPRETDEPSIMFYTSDNFDTRQF